MVPQQGVLCQHKGDALICHWVATVDFVQKNFLSLNNQFLTSKRNVSSNNGLKVLFLTLVFLGSDLRE